MAADPERYRAVGAAVGMNDEDVRESRDWGSEVHRGWRRALGPLWMPAGLASREARVVLDVDARRADELRASGLLETLEGALRRFVDQGRALALSAGPWRTPRRWSTLPGSRVSVEVRPDAPRATWGHDGPGNGSARCPDTGPPGPVWTA